MDAPRRERPSFDTRQSSKLTKKSTKEEAYSGNGFVMSGNKEAGRQAPPKDADVMVRRKGFARTLGSFTIAIWILLAVVVCYIYGCVHNMNYRFHNFKILSVDFDNGIVGRSLQAAGKQLQAPTFPTVDVRPASEFPTEQSVRDAVCQGAYWGAIYSNVGASERLASAVSGADAAYNPTAALSWVWNGARYPAISMGAVQGGLQQIVAVSRLAYNAINGTAAVLALPANNAAAVHAVLNPIQGTQIDIQTMNQGPRLFYNTVSLVFPIIIQFFFLLGLNGLDTKFHVFSELTFARNAVVHGILSLFFTAVCGLILAGMIWAFGEDWTPSSGEYALTWLAFWMYMHIHFLVMEVVLTFLPLPFPPFFILFWTIANVAAGVVPFEVSHGFFKWGYALPGHEVYSVLVQIWSHGCVNRLYVALPVLFAWEVLMGPVAAYSLYKRCGTQKRQRRR
ncbi:hypothetical protein LTR50_000568 [Elasticomyces elasticus]|nr:hypothetical protein LTR50_000472 [Elasticomyces elasticus]KAK4993344.1 hypothetical protein LTR50_000568 [Elasticomyces elasticus]